MPWQSLTRPEGRRLTAIARRASASDLTWVRHQTPVGMPFIPTSISQAGPSGMKKNRCEPDVEWELTPQLSQWDEKEVLSVVRVCVPAPPQPSTPTTLALARTVSASRYPIRREYSRLGQCFRNDA